MVRTLFQFRRPVSLCKGGKRGVRILHASSRQSRQTFLPRLHQFRSRTHAEFPASDGCRGRKTRHVLRVIQARGCRESKLNECLILVVVVERIDGVGRRCPRRLSRGLELPRHARLSVNGRLDQRLHINEKGADRNARLLVVGLLQKRIDDIVDVLLLVVGRLAFKRQII